MSVHGQGLDESAYRGRGVAGSLSSCVVRTPNDARHIRTDAPHVHVYAENAGSRPADTGIEFLSGPPRS